MSTINYVQDLAKLGIKAESTEDVGVVRLTMTQYDKVLKTFEEADLTFEGLLPSENRVVVRIKADALAEAVASNKRAPRTSTNVRITSQVLYTVESDGTNEVAQCLWDSTDQRGTIQINGMDFTIYTGAAGDYYDIQPKEDETEEDFNARLHRAVYVVDLPVIVDGDQHQQTLTSYGVTNLIRRVCATDDMIGMVE
jgi:hypothetical protein